MDGIVFSGVIGVEMPCIIRGNIPLILSAEDKRNRLVTWPIKAACHSNSHMGIFVCTVWHVSSLDWALPSPNQSRAQSIAIGF